MSIASNLEQVRTAIADACARAGRDPASVRLMAVSKTHPPEAILQAIAAGQRLFGENRVQEFAAKRDAWGQGIPASAAFHLIGTLQNNKTTRAAELFDAVDALAELKTAQRINAAAAALGKVLPVLIEVKLSPEETKHGLAPEELPALLEGLAPLGNLRVNGLMTVPPYSDDPEQARPFFARLRTLRDRHVAACPSLTELSMGMSHDFAAAIAEGSTTVRIGTAIFGARDYA